MIAPAVIERLLLAALAAFLLSVPWSVPALINTFWVSVIAEILIWSLLAASVNLLFGYVGLLSFGQALYFGFGMYGVGIGIAHLGLSFWPAFGLGILASVAMDQLIIIIALFILGLVAAALAPRGRQGADGLAARLLDGSIRDPSGCCAAHAELPHEHG